MIGNDDNCPKILRNCCDALPAAGVLLRCESVLNEDFSGPRSALMKDLAVLVACEPGARERNEAEYRSLTKPRPCGHPCGHKEKAGHLTRLTD
jgi:O-methyltransferase domain